MQALEAVQVLCFVAAIASILFVCTLLARDHARRRRRARRTFTAGFICGLAAGVIWRGRRRNFRSLRLLAQPRRLALPENASYLAHRLIDHVSAQRKFGWVPERHALGRQR